MAGKVLKTVEDEHLQDNKKRGGAKQHWTLDRDENDVLWLGFDKKGSGTNTIGSDVLQELDDILNEIIGDLPKALVIRSMKKGGFCAGADITEFKDYGETEMAGMLQRGHDVLDRLEKLSVPTIAIIHGHCLGGGLELALACDMRIGIRGGLQMGLPEIKLGLHPGLGGTFRLVKLINPLTAMTMMLTGTPAFDKQTKKRGLVDALTEERHADNAVKAAIDGKVKKRHQTFKERAVNSGLFRGYAAGKMRGKTRARASKAHYPAPYALIDLWEKHGGDAQDMQKAEIQSFCKLLVSDTAQNLIRVFFLHQGLKDLAKHDSDIQHVHVIGAGAMGGDIAGWCAMQGLKVTLSDQKAEPVGRAIKAAVKMCQSKHKSSIETRDTLDRLIPDMHGYGIPQADLIIEAVPENIELKQKLYEMIEPQMKKGAILATNTSSIPLDKLAVGLKKPERFVGLHFFNPVAKMMVVEIVRHDKAGKKVLEEAMSFTGLINKLPVPVASYPGFLVNRALTPYLLEAMILLDEGVDKEAIDHAAEAFGMPVGPVELADQVGLDICLHVADMLSGSLKQPIAKMPDWLRKKVEDGDLGRKTGRGFYEWKDGRVQKDRDRARKPKDDVTDRLILPMLNACVECYREGVVENLDHLDGAMIFATGFAPFRGGPIHYARARGIDDITSTLKQFARSYGDRFKPDKGWKSVGA